LVHASQSRPWIEAQQATAAINGHRADVRVAGLGDAFRALRLAALVGRRSEPRERADLLAAAEAAPAEELHYVEPGAVGADALEPEQLVHLLDGGVCSLPQGRPPPGLHTLHPA